jgi:hypothetical protein
MRLTVARVLLGVFLVMSAFVSPIEAEVDRDFGVGVNSATGALQGECITFKRPEPAEIKGRSFVYRLQYLESIEQLRSSLGISATASLASLWGKASAKTDFLRSVAFNKYSLFMLIKAEVRSDFIALTEPALRSEVRRPQPGGGGLSPAEFFAQCGDEYIHGVQYGGSVYGLLVIDTNSLSERDDLRASLEVTFGSVNGGATMESTFSKRLKTTSYHVEYFQEGGKTEGMPSRFDDIDAFFRYAKDVEKNILGNPAVLDVETKSYRTLDGSLGLQVPQAQRSALRRLAGLQLALSQRRTDLAYIRSDPNRFVGIDESTLAKDTRAVGKALDTLAFLAEDCFRDASACDEADVKKLETTWEMLDKPLPSEGRLYSLFAFTEYRPTKRWIVRPKVHPEDCEQKFYLETRLGRITILDEVRLTYGFVCEKTGYVYKCGGGSDDHQFEGNVETRRGMVVAELQIENRILHVKNVTRQFEGDPECGEELVRFIRSKDGTVMHE